MTLLFGVVLVLALPAQAQLRLPTPDRPDTSADPRGQRNEPFLSLPKRAPTPVPAPVQRQEPVAEELQLPVAQADEPADEGGEAFSWEVVGTVDWFTKTAGGVPDAESGSAMPGLVDLGAEVDTGAAGLWDNGAFFLHLMYAFGTSPGDFAGDFHGISNIDAGEESLFAVWEAWYEHFFPYSHSSFQLGVLDYNSDFYVAEYANLFLNGAFGMGAELGASTGVSAFPMTALGARLRMQPSEQSYLLLGVFDGMPGPEANEFKLDKDEGSFWAVEGGITSADGFGEGKYYKLGLGAWYLLQDIEHWTGDEPPGPGSFEDDPYKGTAGAYLLAEYSWGESLGLFAKAGMASKENNRYNSFYSAGLNFIGLFPGRDDDVLGIGFVRTGQSDDYLSAAGTSQEDYLAANGNQYGYFKAETVYEITYAAQVFDWLLVQPDLQYVLQPGMDPDIGNAIVVGIRLQAVY